LTHVKKIETEPKLHDKSERKKIETKIAFFGKLETLPFCLGKKQTNYYLSLVLNRAENRTPPTT
jgi:hypothetical protein